MKFMAVEKLVSRSICLFLLPSICKSLPPISPSQNVSLSLECLYSGLRVLCSQLLIMLRNEIFSFQYTQYMFHLSVTLWRYCSIAGCRTLWERSIPPSRVRELRMHDACICTDCTLNCVGKDRVSSGAAA